MFINKKEISSGRNQRRELEPIYKAAKRQSKVQLREENFLALGDIPQRK